MKKRILFVSSAMIMVFIFAMMLVPGSLSQEIKAETKNGYTYTVTDNKIEITKYEGTAESINIGDDLNTTDMTVTSIADNAFSNCYKLKSVMIPNSVESIGKNAFQNCSDLEEVTLPVGITSISDYAFSGCTGLTKINHTDNITNVGICSFYNCIELKSFSFGKVSLIGNSAFYCCTGLTSVELPETVSTIGDYAFSYCIALTKVTLPADSKIKAINQEAFSDCSSLKEFLIPDSVTDIGNYAFANCKNLQKINIPKNVSGMGTDAFTGCSKISAFTVDPSNASFTAPEGVLYTKDMKYLIYYPAGNTRLNYTIPADVTVIGSNAFTNAPLHEINFDLAKNISDIGALAFAYSQINSINIPESVTTIGYSTFMHCENITSIKLPSKIKKIPSNMCMGCTKLSSIEIPSDVTSIQYSAFQNCPELKTVTIPQNVTDMQGTVFSGCTGLTQVIFNNSLTEIPEFTFMNCSNLKSITFPKSITLIDYCAFKSCTSLSEIAIPDTVTTINNGAFNECSSIKNITIPASTSAIGTDVFRNCSNLELINVEPGNTSFQSEEGVLFNNSYENLICYPGGKTEEEYVVSGGVISLSTGAFEGTKLKKIQLSDGITSIPEYTFENCTNLQSVMFSSKLTQIGRNAFFGCRSLSEIPEIPETVTGIDVMAFGSCNSLQEIKVNENNQKYSSQDGVLFDKNKNTLICYPSGKTDATYNKMPDTIKIINYNAFLNCPYITEINIPKSVTSIGGFEAFIGCSALQNVYVADDNEVYYDDKGVLLSKDKSVLFYYPVARKVKSYAIPSSVTIISFNAFNGCNGITNVMIPDSVTLIDDYAFLNCPNLKSVTIPEGLQYLGAYAFGFIGDPTKYDFQLEPDFTIYCYAGTEAVRYAEEFGVNDIIIDHTISTCEIQLSDASLTYDGTPKTTTVTVTQGTNTLTENTDYTISYSSNTNAGKAKVTITGMGKFTGYADKYFEIMPKTVKGLIISEIADQAYTGSSITPDFTVKDGTKLLVKDTDYTVSYLANTEPGTGAVKITGKGNYADSFTKQFDILSKPSSQASPSKSISGMSASLSSTTFIYTGKAKKPKVTLKDGNTSLVEDTDYTVDYINNKEAGTATVTITGIGKYSGAIKLTFSIKPNVPAIKVKAGKKKASIQWSKVKGASGYEISMSKVKKGKYSVIKTVGSSTKGLVKKKLKSGKKYYFKVRAYRTVNGTKIYGEFSNIKKCKVK